MTHRENETVLLCQASVAEFKRIKLKAEGRLPSLQIGIGRRVSEVNGILDSYQDAQLALRTIRRSPKSPKVMSYEDFDYSTRLFADVGFEKMITWARDFLRPLMDKDLIMEGLKAFFENDQSINTAASSLNIHHNSLRYRLTKAEEFLNISLREPAAISSIFLALTALDLSGVQRSAAAVQKPDRANLSVVSDSEAHQVIPFENNSRGRHGVVHGIDE